MGSRKAKEKEIDPDLKKKREWVKAIIEAAEELTGSENQKALAKSLGQKEGRLSYAKDAGHFQSWFFINMHKIHGITREELEEKAFGVTGVQQPAPPEYGRNGCDDFLSPCEVLLWIVRHHLGESVNKKLRSEILRKVAEKTPSFYESIEKHNSDMQMAYSLRRTMEVFDRDFSDEHESIIRQMKIKCLESFLGINLSGFKNNIVSMKKAGRSSDKADDAGSDLE